MNSVPLTIEDVRVAALALFGDGTQPAHIWCCPERCYTYTVDHVLYDETLAASDATGCLRVTCLFVPGLAHMRSYVAQRIVLELLAPDIAVTTFRVLDIGIVRDLFLCQDEIQLIVRYTRRIDSNPRARRMCPNSAYAYTFIAQPCADPGMPAKLAP